MATKWVPKAGRHVHYAEDRTAASGANKVWVPATITNVDSATVLDLRLNHYTTVLNVAKQTADNQTGVWKFF